MPRYPILRQYACIFDLAVIEESLSIIGNLFGFALICVAIVAAWWVIRWIWNATVVETTRRLIVVALLTWSPIPVAQGFRWCLDVLARMADWGTALHKATEISHPAVIRGLIRAGADPNAPYRGQSVCLAQGETPLHRAARAWTDGETAIRILITAGADPNARTDMNAITPLHRAAGEGSPSDAETINVLINAGADPSAPDRHGQTPLHVASGRSYSNAAAVMALIDAGANLMALDDSRRTPLHSAAENKFSESASVFAILIGAGADARAPDVRGRTALQVATSQNRNPAMIEALQHAMADTVDNHIVS